MYLDDYTPIRTIEVTGNVKFLSSAILKFSKDYFRGYFEHAAGPVSDVSIVRKVEDNQTIDVAYVTFLIPEDAAR